MKVMGIDPHGAKPYAITVVSDTGIECQIKGDIKTVDVAIRAVGPDVVFVEDQFMSKNFKVAKMLSWSAGKVMGVCELSETRCETANVATWKAMFGVTRGKGSHVDVSVSLGGLKDDDLASSHLIALYGMKKAKEWTE